MTSWDRGEGNISPLLLRPTPKTMPPARTKYHFVFTWNNYTDDTLVKLRTSIGRAGITYICYGKEVGEQGTPHLQGYLQSNSKNISRFQSTFGPCWIKAAKGTSDEAIEYTQKQGDWTEMGERVFLDAKHPGSRSDLHGIQDAIAEGKSFDEICETNFEACAKYSRFIQSRISTKQEQDYLKKKQEELSNVSLRPWQQSLLDVVTQAPNPRTVHWIWEDQGAVGKSWMAQYLRIKHSALVLSAAKKVDLAHIISGVKTSIVVFDLSRTTAPGEGREHSLDAVFSLAEDLKNGYIVSTKYDSRVISFAPPHVLFFANFPPPMNKLSLDRWSITHINSDSGRVLNEPI